MPINRSLNIDNRIDFELSKNIIKMKNLINLSQIIFHLSLQPKILISEDLVV